MTERPALYSRIKHDGVSYLKGLLPPDEVFLYVGTYDGRTQIKVNPDEGFSILDTNSNEYRLADHHLEQFELVENSPFEEIDITDKESDNWRP